MRRFALLPLFLASTACSSGSATVTIEGIEDFGTAASALWMVIDPVPTWSIHEDGRTLEEWGEAWFDPLNVRSYPWSCADDAAFIGRWGELSRAALDADEAGDEAAWCDAITALEDHEATRPATRRSFSAGSDAGATLPTPGVPFEDAAGFLSYAEEPGDACPAWDPDACAYVGGDDTCGEHYRRWFVEPTAYSVDVADDTVVAGVFEGTLHPEVGSETDGTITVAFEAATCSYDWPQALLLTP